MMRRRANSRGDKKSFTRNAMKVHNRNIHVGPMRGGIRM